MKSCCYDSDKTNFLSKGENRPINTIKHRLEVISELKSVNAVVEIAGTVDFRDNAKADIIHRKVLGTIQPDYLITNIKADDYWKEKKQREIQTICVRKSTRIPILQYL